MKIYRLSEVPDANRRRILGHYMLLGDAQDAGEQRQWGKGIVAGCRLDWFNAPGPLRRWSLHVYAPGVNEPDVTDYLITEIDVIESARTEDQP
jgi:hypothetical protein